jgi:hypothetical protein
MRVCGQFIPISQDVLFKEEKFVNEQRERRYYGPDRQEHMPSPYPEPYPLDD